MVSKASVVVATALALAALQHMKHSQRLPPFRCSISKL
jgi:hypothetical protein